MERPTPATVLLQRLSDGDKAAAAELVPLLHAELHRLAKGAMARTRAGHTLQPTALLNEAWLRLLESEGGQWSGREHFLAVATKAMRSILIDHARKRQSRKRGGGMQRVELDEVVLSLEDRAVDLLALNDALDELALADEALARIVELRFFGGLNNHEISSVTEMSLRSVERGWRSARAWLFQRIADQVHDWPAL